MIIRAWSRATLLLCSLGLAASTEAAEPAEPAEDVGDDYGEAGTFEIGGSVTLSWTDDVFTFTGGPSAGYFPIDYFELSVILDFIYQRFEDDDTGIEVTSEAIDFLVEPSYHLPVADHLFGEGALGIGLQWDGDDTAFELVPKAGVNITTRRGAVISPAISVPMLFGGDPDDDFRAELRIELEVTTTF